MIVTRTPFRISFFGGGTDYPAWYREHGGAVLATTINKYCYISSRYLPPFFEHRIRVVYSVIENCQKIDEIHHPAVREILRYIGIQRGVEIHHDGDLPARSGMGSSSSFTVGLLHALYALQGTMCNPQQLATQSIHLEQNALQETVGSQDQVLAAYGGFNQILFSQNGDFSLRPITIDPKRVQELNANLMLFYTGIQRTASKVAGSYMNQPEDKKQQLRVIRNLVDEAVSILASKQDLEAFGKLLHEGWLLKRSMSSLVSNPQVEQIYEKACHAGAVGGKLTGAGGGGFLLLYAPLDRHQEIRAALEPLINVPFRFEPHGSQVIFVDREEDYSLQDQIRSQQPVQIFRELEDLR